jgi:hypothetical protein
MLSSCFAMTPVSFPITTLISQYLSRWNYADSPAFLRTLVAKRSSSWCLRSISRPLAVSWLPRIAPIAFITLYGTVLSAP